MKIFEDAASILAGEAPTGSDGSQARGLIRQLGFADDAPAPERARQAALFRVAARMERIFNLSAPSAPGLAFVGGTVDPAAFGLDAPAVGVSGCGAAMGHAFAACVGEAVEALAQLEWGDGRLATGVAAMISGASHEAFRRRLEALDAARDPPVWIEGRRLGDGCALRLPADLCIRRHGRDGVATPALLGAGCAAGPGHEAATLSALLELVERDAAALWWIGGRRGALLDLAAASAAAALLASLRRGQGGRRAWLLDITTDLAIPVVAALSVDEDGLGLACGLAARPEIGEAARAAVLELCQMELANHLVAVKRREGATLSAADLRIEARAAGFRAADCALLFPDRPPREAQPGTVRPGGTLEDLVARLTRAGIECFAVDLGRQALGVPCVRVLAPALQPMSEAVVTERLRHAIECTGGGKPCTGGAALL